MGVSNRHSDLTGDIFVLLKNMFHKRTKRDEIIRKGDCDLAYFGSRQDYGHLVDLDEFDEAKLAEFQENTMNNLSIVLPDLLFFKQNRRIYNKNETRIAGFPDLVIEIWSESNTHKEIEFKKSLYSTGATTEHWYIQQDSDVVERFHGDKKLADLSLAEPLITAGGLELDLRYLAIGL